MNSYPICLILCAFLCFNCEEIIEVPDISNETVNILAPTDQVQLNDGTVNFSWETVTDAEQYNLQIASPDFINATQIFLDTIVTETIFTQTLDTGNYQWRVRAENSGFQTAYTTQDLSINVSLTDLSTSQVNLLAPASNTQFTTTDTINFTWESVTDADEYKIQIARPNFASAIEFITNTTQTETTFSISNPTASTYEWRVKAKNSSSESPYSTRSFNVQ